jgi:hypothetical protein
MKIVLRITCKSGIVGEKVSLGYLRTTYMKWYYRRKGIICPENRYLSLTGITFLCCSGCT